MDNICHKRGIVIYKIYIQNICKINHAQILLPRFQFNFTKNRKMRNYVKQ